MIPERYSLSHIKLFPLAILLLSGCPEPEPEGIQPTFDEIYEKVFVPSCSDSGCHSTTAGAGSLVLEGEGVYDSLINSPCDNPIAVAEGLKRINTEDPADSFLYMKITDPKGMGQVMPPDFALGQDETDAILQWIEDGALE